MKYEQPFGNTDEDAEYVDGDTAIGIQGSIPSAAAFENHQRELIALIEKSNLTPSSDDRQQILKATRSQAINYAVDIGTADALQVEFDPAFTELTVGLPIRVKVAYDNTDVTTIQVDGLSPVEIKRSNGDYLVAGDIKAGQIIHLVYDGTNFQIKNFVGFTASVENNNIYAEAIPYVADTSTQENVITAIFNPALTSLSAGTIVEVKIANENTDAVVINVNSISSKQVRSLDLQQLVAGQITVGMMALLQYDGTYFQLCNPAKNRNDSTGIQLVKRYVYQDTDYHINSAILYDTEAFRVTYTPNENGNQVRITVDGIVDSGSSSGPAVTQRSVRIWLQYSEDGGTTWNPPSYPGVNYPSVGGFTAVTHYNVHALGWSDYTNESTMGFRIVGLMDVPLGIPDLIFRVMFAPANSIVRSSYEHDRFFKAAKLNAIINGGSIMEITEFKSLGA